MNNADFEALTRVLMGRIFIELEASGRHVHVTKEQAQTLFGHGLTPRRPLSQCKACSSRKTSRIKGDSKNDSSVIQSQRI